MARLSCSDRMIAGSIHTFFFFPNILKYVRCLIKKYDFNCITDMKWIDTKDVTKLKAWQSNDGNLMIMKIIKPFLGPPETSLHSKTFLWRGINTIVYANRPEREREKTRKLDRGKLKAWWSKYRNLMTMKIIKPFLGPPHTASFWSIIIQRISHDDLTEKTVLPKSPIKWWLWKKKLVKWQKFKTALCDLTK